VTAKPERIEWVPAGESAGMTHWRATDRLRQGL